MKTEVVLQLYILTPYTDYRENATLFISETKHFYARISVANTANSLKIYISLTTRFIYT
jgi:hypothetical protein